MDKRPLGQTGIQVSPLGLGTVKFGRNQKVKYPKSFDLPSDKEIVTLLSKAKELGINLLDTAPAYGSSEERIGKLLKTSERDDWVICSKTGENFEGGVSSFDFSAKATEKSIHRSLQRLNTDYLDVVLVHSDGEDEKLFDEDGPLPVLAKMKDKGSIRAYGISTKTVSGGIRAIRETDIAMVTYNLVETADQKVIAEAEKENKGIFIKKGLASGHINTLGEDNPIFAAMKHIFVLPGVTSVITGTLNPKHLEENALGACRALETL